MLCRTHRTRRTRWHWLTMTALGVVAGVVLSACGGGAADDGGGVTDDVVLPTRPAVAAAPAGTKPSDPTSSSEGGAFSAQADVLAAGDAAVAAAGGQVVRTSVDLLGYMVQIRQADGSFENVQLDVGFGIVFVEPDADGRRDADELADDVDLRLAVDLALETAAGESIGAARDGVVVNAEIERDGYDIDIQYPNGRVLEVRLTDDHVVTGTRIRG